MLLTLAASAAPVAAQDSEDELSVSSAAAIALSGHGWGHGRGMGQYGALGYATEEGWSSAQILDHFYGDTSAGSAGNSLMTVRLLSRDDQPLIVTVASGTQLAYRVGTNGALTQIAGQTGRVVFVGQDSSGRGIYDILTASSCTAAPTLVTRVTATGSGFDDHVAIVPVTGGTPVDPPPPPDPDGAFAYGPADSVALSGDWDGNGVDSIGYREGTRNRFHLRNSNSAGADSIPWFGFGSTSDIPIAGDFNGDGRDEVGVFRPSDHTWHLQGVAGPVNFGSTTDTQPITGDWDGDGDDDLALVRGTTWLFDENLTGGNAEFTLSFDAASDIPLGGNTEPDNGDDRNGYDADTQTFLLGTGAQRVTKQFGPAGASPVLGDWDGDGLDEVGTFHNGSWLLDNSGAGSASGTSGAALTAIDTNDPNLPLNQTLQLCTANGTTWYRGELRAAHFENERRTVNAVRTEQYLRSVVPRESPAHWADLGGGSGMAALESQAVAARSYSLAENRYNYAKTCDTISCQVYSGRQIGAFKGEDPRADTAIANTSGAVRTRGAAVSRTEFSSSTGGYTSGGVFPAVPDAGDDISANPNHDWDTSVTRSRIESYFGLGVLDRVVVTARNGLGEDGGRPTKIKFTFGNGSTREISGTAFQAAFGLKSDWFSFAGVVDEPDPATPVPTTLYVSNSLATGVAEATFGFGTTAQSVLVGDWDGDGVDTFLLRTGNHYGGSNTLTADVKAIDFTFGRADDVVFAGDWDGDGRDTLALRRANIIHISNTLGDPADDLDFSYGKRDDTVYVGDWNGDGVDTFAVRRRNVFFAKDSIAGGNADYTFGYGRAADQVYVGDWNNDNGDSFAVRRANQFYVSNRLVTSIAEIVFSYGRAADEVLVGDYDGDGVQTITVRR